MIDKEIIIDNFQQAFNKIAKLISNSDTKKIESDVVSYLKTNGLKIEIPEEIFDEAVYNPDDTYRNIISDQRVTIGREKYYRIEYFKIIDEISDIINSQYFACGFTEKLTFIGYYENTITKSDDVLGDIYFSRSTDFDINSYMVLKYTIQDDNSD